MSGYSNRVIHLRFDELSEDPAVDPIWVVIRNPRLMPPGELRATDVPTDDDGKPLDEGAAEDAMYERIAKLVIALRAYDAANITVDEQTGELLPQELLRPPVTAALVRRLPMEIINRVADEFSAALDPKGNTTRTSTSQPPVSMMEPGEVGLLPVNSSTSN